MPNQKTKASPVVCSECEKALQGEDLESPKYYTGDTGVAADVLCGGCFDEADLEFDCCVCLQIEHEAYQHCIGAFVFVSAEVPNFSGVDFPPGVYRITDLPYYGGRLCGAEWLFGDAIQRVCDLPEVVQSEGFRCANCCRQCAKAITDRLEAVGSGAGALLLGG